MDVGRNHAAPGSTPATDMETTMKQTHWIAILVLLLTLTSSLSLGSARAADSAEPGIVLNEGQWLFDIRVQMPMQAKPSIQKVTSCVTSEPMTAETLMPWAEKQGCKVRGARVEENRLSWKLRCRMEGQRSRGRGEFSVDGDQGAGEATVNIEMGNRKMPIKTRWTAKRMGPCPAGASTDLAAPVKIGGGE